ncbi:MAG: hypothetical protein KU37_03945 [Sulfuricurvum sp. PC08-66]|nr:MAG: hypothetical protein KU37_03945 [Sulfuricurvum sp. PC08-66]
MNYIWSSIAILIGYLIALGLKRLLHTMSTSKELDAKRLFYIQKVFELLLVLAVLIALVFIWSVDIKGIAVFASSIFAVIGVALFAQWSILSNITSSIIIFFTFPARIGDTIRIVDGENSIEGIIIEISLFQIELRDTQNNTLLYPNNLLLQKPVIKFATPNEAQNI